MDNFNENHMSFNQFESTTPFTTHSVYMYELYIFSMSPTLHWKCSNTANKEFFPSYLP